jgi:hypothetical protein
MCLILQEKHCLSRHMENGLCTNVVFNGYVHCAQGPIDPLCRPLYTLGLDACLYRGKLNDMKLALKSLLQLE